MFSGFHDTYIDMVDSRLLYTLDTKIHHVESWGHISCNMSENLEGLEGSGSWGLGDRAIADANMVRASLLSSLKRVLDNSRSGITLDSVRALPEGALIAGSTVAQACLGVLWEADVDVFCSAKAAPWVRSVSENAACVCNLP